MKKRIIIIVVALLVVAGGAYKFLLSGDEAPPPKKTVEGVLLPLDKEFMVNIASGQIAKVNITLLLDEKDPGAAAAALASEGGAGPVPMHPQNSVIRSVITADLMQASADDLKDPEKQKGLLRRIQANLSRQTDAEVKAVLITDVVVS